MSLICAITKRNGNIKKKTILALKPSMDLALLRLCVGWFLNILGWFVCVKNLRFMTAAAPQPIGYWLQLQKY